MKQSLPVITACLLVLVVASGVYASKPSEQSTATEVHVEKGQKQEQQNETSNGPSLGSIITPDAAQSVYSNTLLSNTATNFSYSVPTGYGYVKVYVQNKGTQRIAISLKKASTSADVPLSPDGTTYSTTTYVEPGKTISLWNKTATGTGTHTVAFSSAGNMTGSTFSLKLGQAIGDLP